MRQFQIFTEYIKKFHISYNDMWYLNNQIKTHNTKTSVFNNCYPYPTIRANSFGLPCTWSIIFIHITYYTKHLIHLKIHIAAENPLEAVNDHSKFCNWIVLCISVHFQQLLSVSDNTCKLFRPAFHMIYKIYTHHVIH